MNSTLSKKNIRILYLDDEENNLSSFRAAFRREYDIYTANTSEEAFSVLKKVKPHIIFSDQRMPVTTGVEFFNAVRQIFPDPVRILITGYTDINDIIQAIIRGTSTAISPSPGMSMRYALPLRMPTICIKPGEVWTTRSKSWRKPITS